MESVEGVAVGKEVSMVCRRSAKSKRGVDSFGPMAVVHDDSAALFHGLARSKSISLSFSPFLSQG